MGDGYPSQFKSGDLDSLFEPAWEITGTMPASDSMTRLVMLRHAKEISAAGTRSAEQMGLLIEAINNAARANADAGEKMADLSRKAYGLNVILVILTVILVILTLVMAVAVVPDFMNYIGFPTGGNDSVEAASGVAG
ncbi:MAG: hypothetical protein DHS20C14_18600 [Phycisphaeraceae bacterium]|nr:MAG: hypothetical protein DHS20C14_18600 [Phycisphaeraceae bacterium]